MEVRQETPWGVLTAVGDEPIPMEIPEVPLEEAPNNSNNNNDNNGNNEGDIFERLGKLETSGMNKELSLIFTQLPNATIDNNEVLNFEAEEEKEVDNFKAEKVPGGWILASFISFLMAYLPILFKDYPNYEGSVGKILEDAKSELDNNYNPGQSLQEGEKRKKENVKQANLRRTKELYDRKIAFLAFFYKLSEKMRKAVDEFAMYNKNEHDAFINQMVPVGYYYKNEVDGMRNEYEYYLKALRQKTRKLFCINPIVQGFYKELFGIMPPGESRRKRAAIRSKTRKAHLNNCSSIKFRWKQNSRKTGFIAVIVLYLHSYRYEIESKILRHYFQRKLEEIEMKWLDSDDGLDMNNVGPYYGQEYIAPQDGIQAWEPP